MIKPILHRILVKPDPVETKTDSGIIIATDTEAKRHQAAAEKGTVVSIGETSFKDYGGDPNLLSVGCKVYYAKYAGKTVKDVDGSEYVILNDEDCLGIFKE